MGRLSLGEEGKGLCSSEVRAILFIQKGKGNREVLLSASQLSLALLARSTGSASPCRPHTCPVVLKDAAN